MGNYIIKICGIRSPEMAAQAALAGVDLIGIMFHPLSPRYVHLDQAVSISIAAKKAGVLPVAVFVNHTDVEMYRICEETNINIVQLHGDIARAHHYLLPNNYQRIYVRTVSDVGLEYLDSARDLILIDHSDPGKGNAIDRRGFHYDLPFPWLLAGGLSPSNVTAAIHDLKPQGVDVSSGVESSRGNKDIHLIKKFVKSVRGLHYDT